MSMKEVDSAVYDEEYYKKINEGWKEFDTGQISKRFLRALDFSGMDFSNKRILDIGCGRGELVAYLAGKGGRCTGIDYSEAAIDIAKKTWADTPGLEFFRMGCTEIDFGKDSFDAVLMLDIVEHLTDQQLAVTFRKIREILKPGGKLILHTMPNAFLAWPFYLLCKMTGTGRGKNAVVHINEQTMFSLRAWLREFGGGTEFYFCHEKNYFKLTNFYAARRKAVKPFVDLFLSHDFSRLPMLKVFAASEIYAIATK